MHNVAGIYYLCTMKLIKYIPRETDDREDRESYLSSLFGFIHPLGKADEPLIVQLTGQNDLTNTFYLGRLLPNKSISFLIYGYPSDVTPTKTGGFLLKGIYIDDRLLDSHGKSKKVSNDLLFYYECLKSRAFKYVWFEDDETAFFPFRLLNKFRKIKPGKGYRMKYIR